MHRFTFWNRTATFNLEGGASSAPDTGAASTAGAVANTGAASTAGGDTSAAGGGQAPLWYSTHPDQAVRQMMADKRFDTPEVLGTAYLHATRALEGASDVIAIPGENSTPEQQAAFFAKLGRPSEAAGYDLTPAEGATNDAGMEAWARSAFHEAGLSNKQARALYEAWNKHASSGAEEYARTSKEAVAQFRQKWGDQADSLIASGQQAARALGLDTASLDAIERAAGTAPMMDLLAQIGKRMGGENGRFVSGSGNSAPTDPADMSVDQAKQAIAALQSDEKFMQAYRTQGHPQHAEAAKKLEKLFGAAYGKR